MLPEQSAFEECVRNGKLFRKTRDFDYLGGIANWSSKVKNWTML